MIHIAAGWSLYFKLGEAGTDVDITTHYYEETYPQQAGLGSEVHAADMSGIASNGTTAVLLVGPAAKSGNRRVARPVICNKGSAHTYYVYLSHQTLGTFYLVAAGTLAAGQTVVWGTDGVPIAASNDHGTLGGLADDDHTQYMLLAGRSGGQVAYGGVTGSQNLDIFPNSSTVTSGRVRLYYPQLIDLITNPTTAGDIFRNGIAFKFYDTAVRKIAPFKDEVASDAALAIWVNANLQYEGKVVSGDAAISNAGVLTLTSSLYATQAEMETGTATNRFVTPGRQQFHQSAAKAWATLTVSAGTPTLQSPSYNVASQTDLGVGNFRFTFSTAFSDVDYAASFLTDENNWREESRTTGQIQILVFTSAFAASDPGRVSLICFGDLP